MSETKIDHEALNKKFPGRGDPMEGYPTESQIPRVPMLRFALFKEIMRNDTFWDWAEELGAKRPTKD